MESVPVRGSRRLLVWGAAHSASVVCQLRDTGEDARLVRGKAVVVLLAAILGVSALIGLLINSTLNDADEPVSQSPEMEALDQPTSTPKVRQTTQSRTQTTDAPPTTTTQPPTEPVPSATTPPTSSDPTSAQPTAPPQPTVQLLSANQPALVAPTIAPFERLYEYYAEHYEFGNITVHWSPGAFPPERAQQIADQAQRLRAEANQRLGTSDNGPLDIFLSTQLYDEKCLGCQGLAASDYRQIFILEDGSVAPDEFEALLIHEITHVIAGGIQLPHIAGLFYAEGLATWMMAPHFTEQGYISPRQTAAWAMKVGQLPTIDNLLFDAQYAGRVRARVEYDAAASFAAYIIETYGMNAYLEMYKREVLPTAIVGKGYPELEQEWRAWLGQWADNEVNGINATEWWDAMNKIISGFQRLYNAPQTVTADQYSKLASARVALNRGELQPALDLARASGLTPIPAS